MTAGNTGIGAGIREQRERLGMSQEALARACMVSRQTISNWETGVRQNGLTGKYPAMIH